MAQKTVKRKKSSPKKTSRTRSDYKAQLEALQLESAELKRQIAEVHRMLDAAETPPNCGTVNGRLVEFAKHWLKRCNPGSMTHPAVTARAMLKAVDTPLWPL